MGTVTPRSTTASMNAPLRAKYKLVLELFASASVEDVRTRYQIGLVISDVKRADKRYGSNAVERLADALGRPASTLYRYSLVADQWPRPALDRVLQRRTATGRPLSWSHLVTLARVGSNAERVQLLERVIKEGLSARQLRALMRPRSASTSTAAGWRRALERLEAFGKASAEWTTLLDAASTGPGDELRELLDRAVLGHRRLLDQVQARVCELEAARKRLAPESNRRPVPAPQNRVPLLLAGG